MLRNVVALLNSEEGRSLVKNKCRAAGVKIGVLENLIEAELDQQGKKRKAGIWEEFDRIFDEATPEEPGRSVFRKTVMVGGCRVPSS
jgi:hypothetical protein